MAVLNGLVPARFLTIVAHLVLIIVLFWSRGDNVQACLPKYYTNTEYERKDTQLIIGLSVSLGLFLLELIGFIGGLSMFLPTQGFISTFSHASAAVSLAYFIQDSWECDTFWYIFSFCSCLPAIVEIIIFMGVCCCNR
ncbi:hypothetical protein LSH36_732g01050 [Paralvinella palmiformis]|uniref:Transmembrane protein 107 n=1 Tax=Paralvinella palmiformis TaxID=53620 RepID=A0AAD9MUN5_9ANNE|nr:hypothetical protein LSH36_732g01050 [Paralvinella palmiformis]